MATIKPFRALLPDPARAADICELPYDVMSAAEAQQMTKGRPDSFLHVSRPEIDLPDGTDPTDPGVYAKARENLNRLIAVGALRKDEQARAFLDMLMTCSLGTEPGKSEHFRRSVAVRQNNRVGPETPE